VKLSFVLIAVIRLRSISKRKDKLESAYQKQIVTKKVSYESSPSSFYYCFTTVLLLCF